MITTGLVVLGVGVALIWTALAIRLIVLTRGPWFRFLNPVEPDPILSDPPSVEAIVPARNEQDHVAATVESLRRQQYPRLTLTLIDDESTDATLAILRRLESEGDANRPPLRVVEGTTRPANWVGKTWAVHQGVQTASAEWLWFVDADMGLHPQALTLAIKEADRVGADLVSFLPGVECKTFWQSTVAISFLHILAHLYPLDRVNDPLRPEALAAGGFLLVRRTLYDRVGGHESVRHAIIEDIALARRAKQAGGRLAVRLAPKLAWTHMYGTLGEIWRGLRKNAYAGMDYQPHKLVVGAIVALTLAWAPLAALGVGLVRGGDGLILIGAWGVLAQIAATIPNLIFVGVSPLFALALPLGITVYVAIATTSAWHYHRGRVLWKGRSIDSATVLGPVGAEVLPGKSEEFRGQVSSS